jgi:hypothetical protein
MHPDFQKNCQRLVPLHTFTTPFMKQDNLTITEAKREFLLTDKWDAIHQNHPCPQGSRSWLLAPNMQTVRSTWGQALGRYTIEWPLEDSVQRFGMIRKPWNPGFFQVVLLFSLLYETTPRIPSLKNGIKQGPCAKSPHIQKQLFALKFAWLPWTLILLRHPWLYSQNLEDSNTKSIAIQVCI